MAPSIGSQFRSAISGKLACVWRRRVTCPRVYPASVLFSACVGRVIKPIISAARRAIDGRGRAGYLGCISRARARGETVEFSSGDEVGTHARLGYGRNRPDAVDSWAVYRPVILRYLVNRQALLGDAWLSSCARRYRRFRRFIVRRAVAQSRPGLNEPGHGLCAGVANATGCARLLNPRNPVSQFRS